MKKITKLPTFTRKDLDSDQFLEQTSLEDLTDFFYQTERGSYTKPSAKRRKKTMVFLSAQYEGNSIHNPARSAWRPLGSFV